jgi:hypothetical protein
MNLISEALLRRPWTNGRSGTINVDGHLDGGIDGHINDFYIDPNILDVPVHVDGLGRVGLTPKGAIRVNSEQLLAISKMEIGKYRTESLENGSFLIYPIKNGCSKK